jgi:recombination protein RecT
MTDTTAVASRAPNPTREFSAFMERMKPQMALALPKHMNADRMARLALTAFSSSRDMQACEFRTIASSLMTAGAMGLEPGVNGAGYLIAYKGVCTFVPGWKGLVDLVSRSGRATVWTGAVFEGDAFDYALGDRPYVRHQPGDETDPAKLTHVYAVGRVNGSDYPVIEVWSMRKVWKHRDALNKQGTKHYSYRHPEMYARKVPLLQVLKYMPSSIEVANAIAVAEAAEAGRSAVIEGNFVTVQESTETDQETGEIREAERPQERAALPAMTAEHFSGNEASWKSLVQSGKKTADALIVMLSTKHTLSDEQRAAIRKFEDFSGAEGAEGGAQ